ncbi:DUF4402 domain-containing protein [Salegentibacter chungangensis]|uniref:DUF4402 domain-containing protein n=1 Tax=Salegentibacter chungangensis TaxID=1335724 RepID=A0ABW3NQK1_9FLAO
MKGTSLLPLFERHFSEKVIFLLFLMFGLSLSAQNNPENPPRPLRVEVRTARNLNFGTFTIGNNGGTIYVSPVANPTRIVTGDIIELNREPVTSAIFDVYANPGTVINIVPASSVFTLTGSNGQTLELRITDMDYSENPTFIAKGPHTIPQEVYIGGTLSVSNITTNPAGQYAGNITINFIQE